MDLDRRTRDQETAGTNEQCARGLVILSLNLRLRLRPPLSKLNSCIQGPEPLHSIRVVTIHRADQLFKNRAIAQRVLCVKG